MSTIAKQNDLQARKKVSAGTLIDRKGGHQKITMLTAYDYSTASLLDRCGIDAILVGDSLGMVVLGYENTLPVTMDDMLHHCKAVARGSKNCLLVGDLPFMSYQISNEEAVKNAGRLLAEGGMGAVKLEGGIERVSTIRAIVEAGIPVMGHLGLTPQSVHKIGGFKPQGKTSSAAKKIYSDAQALQDAGCFSIVLESIPEELAKLITEGLDIPTIGIGAGKFCDGQVLVTHDALGLFDGFLPKFARRFVNANEVMTKGITEYIEDVSSGSFPAAENSVTMRADELMDLKEWLDRMEN